MKNLLTGLAEPADLEQVDALLSGSGFRLERIVSRGHCSPPDFWYDAQDNEWVLLVSGRARIEYQDGSPEACLESGDYLEIPAHQRHRVSWTDPDQPTIWLALHHQS